MAAQLTLGQRMVRRAEHFRKIRENWRNSWNLFRQKPLGMLGVLLILLFCLMAIVHPLLMSSVWDRTTYHPQVGFDYDLVPHPTMPSMKHILGTDSMGRDIFSQLLYATQTSFGLGLIAGIVATSLATIVGVLSAHFGGLAETILMGISDAFVLMPPPVVLLVVGLLLDLGWFELALIFGVFAGLGSLAIIAKADAQSIKIKPYIEAARLAGGSAWYIIRAHYLPNMLSLMLVNMMFTVTQSVLIEAVLSFFGRTHLRMSWGTMIWFTQVTFRLSPHGTQWHALLPPVLSIMLFCSAFYMVGRSLDEIVNPRIRRR